MLGPGEFLLIAAAVLLLFGYKKLPDASRAVGRSLRIFKAEVRGLSRHDVRTRAPAQTARGPLGPDNHHTDD